MRTTMPRFFLLLLLAAALPAQYQNIAPFVAKMDVKKRFFTIYRELEQAKIYLAVDRLEEDFLYVNSLPSGVGSNDSGLDRGKLGSTKVVRFHRVGKRLMLIQRNLGHRATTNNPDEKRAVVEAFASSIISSFDIVAGSNSTFLVDATDFCVRDAFNVVGSLRRSDHGAFKMDPKRSFLHWAGCGAFPKNTEMQATLTFAGTSPGITSTADTHLSSSSASGNTKLR